ncbi:AbrB family transcriptional regulator [Candidatus Bathyarchaeota archaeon]|nr:MAG: AbrB family transcriptional regulator [Candidatus Bathyarchaeota archaeon]HDI42155.1 AbrB/MazE/SpoVT family DNA-binding domain-containing protein [Candidatus Bathyarchaeota archaeon]
MQVRLEKGGRITIPRNVLESLNLKEGDTLELQLIDRTIILRAGKRITVDDLWGIAGTWEVDLEEVEDAPARQT